MDTPITIEQNNELIAWIEHIAPGRKLRYIYITHGHGDHFFGIPQIVEKFPGAIALATPGTIRHMEEQIEPKQFETLWESRFPGHICKDFKIASPFPDLSSQKFTIGDKYSFEVIEAGHSDTSESTVLWVPDLRLAVCGDVVYGQVHQMLAEANTRAKREEWIRGIEKVEALKPSYVVPGHRQAEEIDGVWHLAATKKYIEDFGTVLRENEDAQSPKEIIDAMVKLYPDRLNTGALTFSAVCALQAPKEERI